MSGFDNEVVYADNVDFSGGTNVSGKILTDGQMIIGSTMPNAGGTHINVGTIVSKSSSLIVGYTSPNVTLEISGSGGTSISTINGDSGSISGSTTTIHANQASLGCGSSVRFTNSGTTSTLGVTDGLSNTLIGLNTGKAGISGAHNAAVGYSVLSSITSGTSNVGIGSTSLTTMQTGNNNIALGTISIQNAISGDGNVGIGAQSLQNISSGDSNIGIGTAAGQNLTTNDSRNILIGNLGTSGLNNSIQIGTSGTHTECIIAGINGVAVTGSAVLCDTNGKLGTVASSKRYKENIKDMPQDISVLSLRPVEFNYKANKELKSQYGLIAEDVDRDFPYLCIYNQKNEPESVKYHELGVFLLHEVKKLEKRLSKFENPRDL